MAIAKHKIMKTSQYGNAFSIIRHLCEDCASHRGIPLTKGPVMRNFDLTLL